MSNYPEGVNARLIARENHSDDDDVLVTTCPCDDCDFDGEVSAQVFLLVAGATSRTLEYQWTCPGCGTEVVEERELRDGEDD